MRDLRTLRVFRLLLVKYVRTDKERHVPMTDGSEDVIALLITMAQYVSLVSPVSLVSLVSPVSPVASSF